MLDRLLCQPASISQRSLGVLRLTAERESSPAAGLTIAGNLVETLTYNLPPLAPAAGSRVQRGVRPVRPKPERSGGKAAKAAGGFGEQRTRARHEF